MEDIDRITGALRDLRHKVTFVEVSGKPDEIVDKLLLSSQLNRLSRRAALGLGRVGSHAASTSGEIVIAFSTANRTPRTSIEPQKLLKLKFVADAFINPLYECVIEATEEAVVNAMFCSGGMTGRDGRAVPAIPAEEVLELLRPAAN